MHLQLNSFLFLSIHGAIVLSKINAESYFANKDITTPAPFTSAPFTSAPFTSPPITLAPENSVLTFTSKADFRCGSNEYEARMNCGKVCIYQSDCKGDEYCWGTFPNICYANEHKPQNPEAISSETDAPAPSKMPTSAPIAARSEAITADPTVQATQSQMSGFLPVSDYRCGVNEEDSRTSCGKVCTVNTDCDRNKGEYCWSTFANKCYLQLDDLPAHEDLETKADFRCGINEVDARVNCGKICEHKIDCENDEYCFQTQLNVCHIKEKKQFRNYSM